MEKNFLSAFQEATKRGSPLWCEGITPPPKQQWLTPIVIGDVSSSDDEQPSSKKVPKRSALDEKAARLQSISRQLQAKHSDTFQYKLWAEALDVDKHKSMEEPPPGTIWGTSKDSKQASLQSDAMNEAFTTMETSIATALMSLQVLFSKRASCVKLAYLLVA